MRYLLCSALLVTLLSHQGMSQSSIGIKVGMGLSMPSITFQPDPYYGGASTSSSIDGMVFGLITQVPLGSSCWLKPAAQVSFKGYRTFYGGYSYGQSVTYLEMPLNIVYSSGKKGSGFQLGGGPVLGYLLNPNFHYNSLRRGDISLNVLTGYQTPIGFSFNLSYTHSFTNAVNNETDIVSFRNRFLAFAVGYLF